MIMHRSDQTLAIRALRSAAPYIRMYKGKTFVVKVGGGVFADPAATRVLIEQIRAQGPAASVRLPARLVVRESSGGRAAVSSAKGGSVLGRSAPILT